jgi:hypothetical protein
MTDKIMFKMAMITLQNTGATGEIFTDSPNLCIRMTSAVNNTVC